ncbi:MAG TPA: biopolymer transporter ExbD [Mucilaginibacter sp.]
MAELNQSSANSGGRHRTKKMPIRVDLTAMVDLAFLLITFFMLTTSLSRPRNMPVDMPVKDTPEPRGESSTMSVCLGAKNKLIYYLGRPEKPLTEPKVINYGKDTRTAIMERMSEVAAKSKLPFSLIIKPSDHSVYQNLVDVLDEANITKVPSYAIAQITASDIEMLKQKGIY